MTETIGFINNLNRRYPVALRRLAIGSRTEQKILNEVKNAKRIKYTLLVSSAFLLGVSVTNIFYQKHNKLSLAITASFSALVLTLLLVRYLQAVTLEKKYAKDFKEDYAISVKKYIDNHINDLPSNLPNFLKFTTKIKIFEVLLNYERSLTGLLLLSGDLDNHTLSYAAMRKINAFKCADKLPRQAAMSILNRTGGVRFVRRVFDSILKTNSIKAGSLTTVQVSIAAAKAALSTEEVRSLPPYDRASVVHQKVTKEFGNCWTSEGQIEEDIAKNRHPSLDKILHKFDRIESP